MNLTTDLLRYAHATPSAPALLLPEGDVSYEHLNQQVWGCAQYLHNQGVRAEQVVGLTVEDEYLLVLTQLAVMRLGATVFSVSRSATPHQRRNSLARAQVKVTVSDATMYLEPEYLGVLVCWANIEEALSRPFDTSIMVDQPTAPWLLITGSGTTGQPKLIPVTHAQGRHRNAIATRLLGLRADDRTGVFSHFDFSLPKFRMHEAFSVGASIAIRLWGKHPWVDLKKRKINVVFSTVFHVEYMLQQDGIDRDWCQSLRIFEVTSSTVTQDLRGRFLQQVGPCLHVRYGINEVGPVCIALPDEVGSTTQTVGQPIAPVRVVIVDRAGVPVPTGTVGHIRMQSPGLMSGYLNQPEANATCFYDGWFAPGDLGWMTPAGDLIYHGRADHMMIMNGVNIYPAEIESTLLTHPAVSDVAAVPVSHPVNQDIPVCAVARYRGWTVSESELLAYARERLGSKGPHRVYCVEKIPRNHEGKLDRSRLKAEILKASHPWTHLSVGAGTAEYYQPVRQLRCEFAFDPLIMNVEGLHPWLTDVLGLDVPTPQLTTTELEPEALRVVPWVWRVLLLARALLQAIRVPVFDSPAIVALSQVPDRPSSWTLNVAMAWVEHIPVDLYTQVLQKAIRLGVWATQQPVTDVSRAVFFTTVEQQVILRLNGLNPGGKSTFPVLRVAHAKGIPFVHLGAGVYQLGWGNQSRRLDRSTIDADSAMGARLAQSKTDSARLLRAAGFPVPPHELVRHETPALKAAERLGWPVVIKPADRDRGEGVTVDVTTPQRVQSAFAMALQASRAKQVLVERQVSGVCHRLFVAHGRLLYAVKRLPMSVQGNGSSTVAELVEYGVQCQQRIAPWLRSELQPLDDWARAELARLELTPESVPAAGQWVPLRRIESTEWGGVDEDVTQQIHPDNVRLALAAAELFGLQVAGIDMISADITQPWHSNGAVLNEVNFAPLLGGGEISRHYIPAFLEGLIQGQGRIPVEVFAGGESAWQAAMDYWEQCRSRGQQAWLTRADLTLGPDGAQWPMTIQGAVQRARALVLHSRVEVLVWVLDELTPGMTFEGFVLDINTPRAPA